MSITVANRVSLMTAYPNIANEWHPRNTFSPSDVTSHSHKRAWWQCEHGHEWESVINNRTSNGNCCPYCSGRLPTEASSLGFLRPDLVKEWHPTKNKMTPFDVTQFSHKSVWWQCKHGHEWISEVANRTNIGSGCPYCAGNLYTSETCLAAAYPEIASEWHPTKNDRTAQEVTRSGKYRAWWCCSICGHEWRTSINNRTDKGSECPKCKIGISTSASEIRVWSEMVYVFGNNVRNRFKDLGFELDVFIPDLQVGIEYDGLRWHKDIMHRDAKKYELTKQHNIFLIRISELPEAPADKVFVAKKVTLHLLKTIVSYLQDYDKANLFSDRISGYLETKNFQNSELFKTTYDAIRKRQ
jgi:hypothetical protein